MRGKAAWCCHQLVQGDDGGARTFSFAQAAPGLNRIRSGLDPGHRQTLPQRNVPGHLTSMPGGAGSCPTVGLRRRFTAETARLSAVQIHGVDPRDTRWERYSPAYRVYFWDGGSSDEYEITDGDAPEVLAWAEAEAHRTGRAYVLWLRYEDRHDGAGLIRLAGGEQPSEEGLGEGQRPAYATDRPAI